MADYNESYGILQVLWGEIHQLLMKWRMEKPCGFHRVQDKAFATVRSVFYPVSRPLNGPLPHAVGIVTLSLYPLGREDPVAAAQGG